MIVINGLNFSSLKRKGGYLTELCKSLDYAYRFNMGPRLILEPDPWEVGAGEFDEHRFACNSFGINIYRSRVTKRHYAELAYGLPLSGPALARHSAPGGARARRTIQSELLECLFDDLDDLSLGLLDVGAEIAGQRYAQAKAAGHADEHEGAWRSQGGRLAALSSLMLSMPAIPPWAGDPNSSAVEFRPPEKRSR